MQPVNKNDQVMIWCRYINFKNIMKVLNKKEYTFSEKKKKNTCIIKVVILWQINPKYIYLNSHNSSIVNPFQFCLLLWNCKKIENHLIII